jgi:hypothetical protein
VATFYYSIRPNKKYKSTIRISNQCYSDAKSYFQVRIDVNVNWYNQTVPMEWPRNNSGVLKLCRFLNAPISWRNWAEYEVSGAGDAIKNVEKAPFCCGKSMA